MSPSKKKLLKPREVSLESSLKEETPIIDLPNDENKLSDDVRELDLAMCSHLRMVAR